MWPTTPSAIDRLLTVLNSLNSPAFIVGLNAIRAVRGHSVIILDVYNSEKDNDCFEFFFLLQFISREVDRHPQLHLEQVTSSCIPGADIALEIMHLNEREHSAVVFQPSFAVSYPRNALAGLNRSLGLCPSAAHWEVNISLAWEMLQSSESVLNRMARWRAPILWPSRSYDASQSWTRPWKLIFQTRYRK